LEGGVEHAPESDGGTRGRISTALVGLHTRHHGKGPTAAKTWVVDDMLVCILQDPFTQAERTLIAEGQGDAVYQMRDRFQIAISGEVTRLIEEHARRKVIAHMHQINIDPDLSVDVFVLEPVATEAAT
jgi:uncharacterized protein YbcI